MTKILIAWRYTFVLFLKIISNIFQYPFSQMARHRLSHAYEALQFAFYGKNYVDLSDLLQNNDLQVILAPVKAGKHNTTAFELAAITAMVKDKACNRIFEIGTFDGRTTLAMALNLQNSNGKIFTLNLPAETNAVSLETGSVDVELASIVISGERFLHTPQQQQIEQLWGDSADFDFAPFEKQMDLVFIDGAHSESYVANDTKKALQLIKQEGGWILWHDAPYFGVVKFLKQWVPQQKGPVYFIKGTTLAAAFIKDGAVSSFNI